jgi:uncharacterized OB-fold protein
VRDDYIGARIVMIDDKWDWAMENREFWDASERGILLVKRCIDCEKPHYYPRLICPHCGSDSTEWIESCGKGILYSYSFFRRANPPQILAYVTLAEGITLLTEIINSDYEKLAVNDEVEVKFRVDPDGRYIPVYVLVK